MTDPDLREAKTALETLSQDPSARRLAEERERAAWNHRYTMAQERKEGRLEGREEGRLEGREEALRDAVEQLCRTLGVPVTEAQRANLQTATQPETQAILDHVAVHRKWPG